MSAVLTCGVSAYIVQISANNIVVPENPLYVHVNSNLPIGAIIPIAIYDPVYGKMIVKKDAVVQSDRTFNVTFDTTNMSGFYKIEVVEVYNYHYLGNSVTSTIIEVIDRPELLNLYSPLEQETIGNTTVLSIEGQLFNDNQWIELIIKDSNYNEVFEPTFLKTNQTGFFKTKITLKEPGKYTVIFWDSDGYITKKTFLIVAKEKESIQTITSLVTTIPSVITLNTTFPTRVVPTQQTIVPPKSLFERLLASINNVINLFTRSGLSSPDQSEITSNISQPTLSSVEVSHIPEPTTLKPTVLSSPLGTVITPPIRTKESPLKITGISPDTGTVNSVVTNTEIKGINFKENAKVTLTKDNSSPIEATDVKVVSSSSIICNITIPKKTPIGAYSTVVTNSDGESSEYMNVFTIRAEKSDSDNYKAQSSGGVTVTSISPNSGRRGVRIVIKDLIGMNFISGANVKLKRFGGEDIEAINVVTQESNRITCTFVIPNSADLGFWDVVIENADGSFGILKSGFIVMS
jgi:hypothetical protein